nr:hypothetical protein [uncultured Flavobacterium sp.]
MNTAKYILKKTKIMGNSRTLEIKKNELLKSTKKSKGYATKDHLDDTYFLLSQMYSQENDPLFI